MNSDFSPELRRELLDDFYAECDELLSGIRDGLVQLEGAAGLAAPDAKVLEGLFRGTHSLKGISAIVGLRPAEQLAHGMEDLLRALSRHEVAVTEAMVDELLTAVQRVEKIVTAHRLAQPLPEMEDLLGSLRRFIPTVASSRPVPAPAEPIGSVTTVPAADPLIAARAKGLAIYHVSFAPSAALDQRGVNLNSVRDRLSGRGEIITAAPVVREKGSIVFEFVVGFREMPADAIEWQADGIQVEREETSAASGRAALQALSVSGGQGALAETSSLMPSHMVRVDLARLDDLMRITGEMVIQRSRLEERLQQNGGAQAGLREINLALGRSLRDLRQAVSRVRMVPVAEIFTRMPFVVRDLRRDSDKKVRVVLEGNQTEVDKYLVERLKEPLLHLVRNAFAHGIEPAAERAAAGKPTEATITLSAQSRGDSVVIQVGDDGRGVDAAAIVARAVALGVPVPARVEAGGLLEILCAPGFSIREQADREAGRGVGMAVVATTVRELGGRLTLDTTPGAGTKFTLKLPLTLSIANAIIVGVDRQICAVPQNAVEEIIQVAAGEVRTIADVEVIPYRSGLLPLVRLRKMFGSDPEPVALLTLLVVHSERGAAGLVVDRVHAQREIVVRPLADPLLHVAGITGATELGDGRPLLILDPHALTQGVVRPGQESDLLESSRLEAPVP